MKKYISASKRDDLLKEKAAWKFKYDARKQLHDDQIRNYRKATYDWSERIVNLVKSQFSSYISKLPNLRVSAESGWNSIQISFNYEDRNNANISLRWSYTITLKESGEVARESNSWSGFDATTPEQIDDLMNSVSFLKAIVDFDWAPILNKANEEEPKYQQYVGVRDPDYDPDYKDPGYDKMIKEATLDEIVGKDIWVKGKDYQPVWYKLISATPAFYTYVEMKESTISYSPEYALEKVKSDNKYDYRKIRKEKMYVTTPVETITQDEFIKKINELIK